MIASPSQAQGHNQQGTVVPYVCDDSDAGDVTARFVNYFGHFLLSIHADQENNGDNAGATVDGIDGVPFRRLDMDFKGTCDGTISIIYFGAANVQGATATCDQAIQTPAPGGYTHLTFTPSMFGVAEGSKIGQFTVAQFTSDTEPRNDLITNVRVNGAPIAPNTQQIAKCQFTN